MKILHITPNAPYNDYWGYQDNLLPKYQKKLGYDVSIIVPTLTHDNGIIVNTGEADYVLKDGVRVIRKKYHDYHLSIINQLFTKIDIIDILYELKPDFIFFHGLISATIFDVIKYKKNNPSCIIVEDNHLDYNIGSQSKGLKKIIGREYFRWRNRKTIDYVEKVYGVTPWRKQYAEDYFKISQNKTDVLLMGADDEKIDFKNRYSIRGQIRNNYCISNDDFLIVTGGKIDRKKNIHLLMEAMSNCKNIKLLIFGSIAEDIKNEFIKILENSNNIIYIGWISADEVYNYFFAADLIAFPGQHSVLWEQACASKTPCIFERWSGMEHVNNGGNSIFFDNVSIKGIKGSIESIVFTDKYYEMYRVANSTATDIYLYSNIAKKSLECLSCKNNM